MQIIIKGGSLTNGLCLLDNCWVLINTSEELPGSKYVCRLQVTVLQKLVNGAVLANCATTPYSPHLHHCTVIRLHSTDTELYSGHAENCIV